MDDQGERVPDTARPPKRFGRRTTLKILGLTLTGAATGATRAVAQSGQTSTSPVGARATGRVSTRGRAWRFRPLATGTTPRAFSAGEFAIVACLVDLIIPDTDTPGAKTAGVHWYLDDIARNEPKLLDQLRAGCRRLDEHARAADGLAFIHLPSARQIAVLTRFESAGTGTVKIDHAGQPQVTGPAPATLSIAPDDRSFFALIKAQTVDAYYKSEMGQLGELEWVGHEFNDEFYGRCTHQDPLVHPRPRWPRARP